MPGTEIIIGTQQSAVNQLFSEPIARRATRKVTANAAFVVSSEISLHYVLSKHFCLKQCTEPADRRIKQAVLKTAACLMFATAGYGTYNL